jgi:20S proteasome alpha/beta subunit
LDLLLTQCQVEYAVKAVENGGTAIGIRCKDGVVLALEKLITSKLLKADANKRISTVDRNMGVVSTSVAQEGCHASGVQYLQSRSLLVCSPTVAIS